MSRTFSSLGVPDYRTFFIGTTFSNIGTWLIRTAQSWLVLTELTRGDALALGWLTSFMYLPILLLTPISGRVADRFPKRTILLVTQVWFFADIVLLTVLKLSGSVQLWMVFALALSDGLAMAFDGPARGAIVSEIVPVGSLANAIGLNSTSFNAARLLGPGLAGLLIAVLGTGAVFAVGGVTFVVFFVCLLRIAGPATPVPRAPRGSNGMLSAVSYVLRRPDLTLLLLVALGMGTFGFNYTITNPLMATQVFGKGAGEYGALGSIMGIGSLTAALLAARRPRPRIRHVVISLGAFAGSMIASALAPTFTVFMLVMIPLGLASVSLMVSANALVQMGSDAQYRGRVMALWNAVIMGLLPVVSPGLGWVGNAYGGRATVLVCAAAIVVMFVLAAIYLFVHEGVRMHVELHRPFVHVDTLAERDEAEPDPAPTENRPA